MRGPLLPAGFVRRPRVEDLLERGAERGLVLVCAPAGFAKTVTAAAWAAGHPRVAWVTLDSLDRDPTTFLRYVQSALAAAMPEPAASLMRALEPSSSGVLDEEYVAAGLNIAAEMDANVTLVLDDFHQIGGSPTEALVARLLRYRPRRLGLVILTRKDPALGQHRLRLAGEVTEIRADDLAFSWDEAQMLLASADEKLSDEHFERIFRRSEGWPTALRLIRAALEDDRSAPDFLARVLAAERHIGDYLISETLERQPADLKRFLMQVSIADPLSASLALAITGRHDSGRLLAEASAANLFLTRLDGSAEDYRLNPIFADLLQHLLHANNPGDETRLHRAAASWYHSKGMTLEAVQHYLAAGDRGAATDLIADRWLVTLLTGATRTLRTMLQQMAATGVGEEPELLAATAGMAWGQGEGPAAANLLAKAAQGARNLPSRRGFAVQALSAALLLLATTFTGDEPASHHETVLQLLAHDEESDGPASPDPGRAVLLLALGCFETTELQWEMASRHLHQARAEAAELGLWTIEVACDAQLATHDLWVGEVDSAQRRCHLALSTAASRGWSNRYLLSATHENLAVVALLRDENSRALEHLTSAVEALDADDLAAMFRVAFLEGVALRAGGHIEQARQALDRLHKVQSGWDTPRWARTAGLLADIDQLLSERRISEAVSRLGAPTARGLSFDTTFPSAAITRPARVVQAAVALGAGRPEDAARSATVALQEEPRPPAQTAVLAAGALAARQSGHLDLALEKLEAALAVAEPRGLLWPFVTWEGQMVELLGEQLSAGTPHRAFAELAVRHCAVRELRTQTMDPLSQRELEILRHLQGTLLNDEIANRLYVSVSTLKTHINHINRKLGTRNRREAVQRARALGLL